MSTEAGLAWFRVAVFITLVSLVLLPFEPRDSAEFVITVTSLVIGLVFMALVAIMVRRSSR